MRRHPRSADRRGHGGVRDRRSLSASARPDGRNSGLAVQEAGGGRKASRATIVIDTPQRVEAVVAAFAKGEIVVVADDDDRENEGDLFVAASLCTSEKMALMIRRTSGIVCA